MKSEITQRELRNASGAIMRALDRGESFVVTRNGVAVGELRPVRRRRFVSASRVLEAFTGAAPIESRRFRRDVDAILDLDPDAPCLQRPQRRGLLDTSVVIDLERITPAALPTEAAISSLTLAELAAGPHATSEPAERARRQERLQRAEATFDPLPFDAGAARAYGLLYAAVLSAGRKARGQRAIDLLVAAVARANGLPLYTRNPADFAGLADLVEIVAVET